MYFVSWIVVGLVASWFGGKILQGNTYGPFMEIGMGIGGAVAGGLLMQSAGFSGWNHPYYLRCDDWRAAADVGRGPRKRQKEVRSAALSDGCTEG